MAAIGAFVWGCTGPDVPRHQDASGPPQDDFHCPNGTEQVIEPSGGMGSDGWQRFCAIRQGPFRNYYHGKKVTDGQYDHGKRTGSWLSFGPNGDVSHTTIFDGGTVVAEVDGGLPNCGGPD
jgi:hypothetical protein